MQYMVGEQRTASGENKCVAKTQSEVCAVDYEDAISLSVMIKSTCGRDSSFTVCDT
jgi:hypothetical protein